TIALAFSGGTPMSANSLVKRSRSAEKSLSRFPRRLSRWAYLSSCAVIGVEFFMQRAAFSHACNHSFFKRSNDSPPTGVWIVHDTNGATPGEVLQCHRWLGFRLWPRFNSNSTQAYQVSTAHSSNLHYP